MINQNPKYECIATQRFTMRSDAPNDDALIAFANSLSLEFYDEELDSLDLGDSMGVFTRIAHDQFYAGELFTILPSSDGFSVEIEMDIDLFKWNRG